MRGAELVDRDGRSDSALAVGVGWFCAVTLFVATVMTLLLAYDITAPELPSQPRGHPNLLKASVAFFANERDRWTQEVISGVLYFAGFVALVAIALLLARRLNLSDGTGSLFTVALGIGATLGVASGLLSLGAEQAAIDPHVCDCKYSSTQLISQDRGLILINSSADWLLYGFFALAAVGFAIAALRLGAQMGRGWRYLSGLIAVLFVVGLVARAAGAGTLSDVIQGVGGGILIPAWAVWTGQNLRRVSPSAEPALI